MEEQIERNNEPNNNLIYVNRNVLRLKLFKILNYINGNLINSTVDTSKLKYLFDYLPFYSRYRDEDDHEKNIFSEIILGGNNLLLFCCINKLDTICQVLIEDYGTLFDIGETNHNHETALIISIKNNMFDVVRTILDYSGNDDYYDANLGQVDKFGKTAMDYMLQKVKVDEFSKPLIENKEIVDNIEIIVDLLYFYLNETNNNTLMDRNVYLNSENDSLQNYIDLICHDLEFWKPLLEGYFKNDTRIKFTEDFCFNVPQAEVNTNQVIQNTRPFRSNRFEPNLPVATSTAFNPLIRQPRSSNQPLQIQQYKLIPKNTEIPPPLPEYDVNNPGTIITYPTPYNNTNSPDQSSPSSPDNKKRPRDKKDEAEDEDEENEYPSKKNIVPRSKDFEPEFGGYKKSKKSNKKKSKKSNKKSNKKSKKSNKKSKKYLRK